MLEHGPPLAAGREPRPAPAAQAALLEEPDDAHPVFGRGDARQRLEPARGPVGVQVEGIALLRPLGHDAELGSPVRGGRPGGEIEEILGDRPLLVHEHPLEEAVAFFPQAGRPPDRPEVAGNDGRRRVGSDPAVAEDFPGAVSADGHFDEGRLEGKAGTGRVDEDHVPAEALKRRLELAVHLVRARGGAARTGAQAHPPGRLAASAGRRAVRPARRSFLPLQEVGEHEGNRPRGQVAVSDGIDLDRGREHAAAEAGGLFHGEKAVRVRVRRARDSQAVAHGIVDGFRPLDVAGRAHAHLDPVLAGGRKPELGVERGDRDDVRRRHLQPRRDGLHRLPRQAAVLVLEGMQHADERASGLGEAVENVRKLTARHGTLLTRFDLSYRDLHKPRHDKEF